MCWRDGNGQGELEVRPDIETKLPFQRRLDRGDVDLTVPLGGVPVARAKQRAFGPDGKKQGRPCDKFLVVHVPAMASWRSRVEAPPGRGRCDSQDAKEGARRQLQAGSERRKTRLAVDGDDLAFPAIDGFREHSLERGEHVVSVRRTERDG